MSNADFTRAETLQHILRVAKLLNLIIRELVYRAGMHDASKLEEPEFSLFCEYTPKLRNSTYGSEEYKQFLKALKPALEHHYAKNRHHPEHFPNGINDMTLIDLIEMLVDWKAASERHSDGDIFKSIEINSTRFGISQQLANILKNTAVWIKSVDG